MILADGVGKSYLVHRRGEALGSAIAALWRRRYEEVAALREVSFRIEEGERVGVLGPNGAGKTTLMKLLSGLLHPSAGHLRVEGHDPSRREDAFLKRIGLVMGNKGQLIWDLPPVDTFDMIRVLFRVPRAEYRRSLAELAELLQLGDIMTKPTRQLSLGERMRCEVAASLIHQPRVLFLDEPTIGLDVSMQAALRDFVAEYNRRREATVLLTSHYMEDVRVICPRVIIVDQGSILYDGELRRFVAHQRPEQILTFSLNEKARQTELSRFGTLMQGDEERTKLIVPRDQVPEVVRLLLDQRLALDLTIEDPPLEELLRQMFGRTPAPAVRQDEEATT
ncbi:ABC transporter ATP-binding protein [Paludibacterium paludis]|uniref:ABC transporter n=1 Tax=Paludibacterium paludis TaxID=1225769 RepID=A0A918P651_9NEIS|nr:ATP-binding cassette domain-containing protein [Paludibacterium paludis]GGY24567.1 ABC transporter [Paludibacterium paludis]